MNEVSKNKFGRRLLHHEDLGGVSASQLNSNRLYDLSFGGEHDVREVVDPSSSKTEYQRTGQAMLKRDASRMWQTSVARQHAGQLIRPKFHKNMSRILNSELVKAKPFSSLQELKAHVKLAWCYFKPVMLRNSAGGMPERAFI